MTALLYIGLGLFIHQLVKRQLFASVDNSLLISAQAIRDAKFPPSNKDSVGLENLLSKFLGERSIRLYALLIDTQNNQTKIQSRDIRLKFDVTPISVKRAQRGVETFETFQRVDKPAIRQLTLPVVRSGSFTGEVVQVGTSLEATNNWLTSLRVVLGTMFPISLTLSILIGYWMAVRSLRPVRAITRAASNMHVDRLQKQLRVPEAKDELQELTLTFNGMLSRLQQSFVQQKRFTGDVSHELRTSLAVLIGETEFSRRKERSATDYKKSLEMIHSESMHMSHIVEELLLLTRVENQAIKVLHEDIDSNELMRLVEQRVDSDFKSRGVELVIENNIVGKIKGSKNYLNIVLSNILMNAAKHSDKGSKVNLKTSENDDTLSFKITDEGSGIAADSLPHIFEPFYRADTSRNRSAGGVGIGLSLAQALAELHEGSISVESEEGKGSIFTLNIPSTSEVS